MMLRRSFLQASATLFAPTLVPELALAAAYAVVPIVAGASALRDISLGTLRRVFRSEQVTDASGVRLVGFNHRSGSRARELFDRVVLGMDPDDVARYWVDQRIRGSAPPPRTVATVALLKEVINRYPGSIGYLALADLDASVRALTVGGTGPDSPQYPLR
jgi:hypothetical protein